MRAFIVRLQDRPGALAELGEALGERGVNIIGVCGMTSAGGEGGVGIIADDDDGARSTLEERDDDYREVEVVSAGLEDRPGALGAAARRLAQRDVNIEVLIPRGRSGSRIAVAFGVNDPVAATEALGDLAVDEAVQS